MSDKIAEIEKRNRERTQGEWEVVRSRDVFSAVVLPGVAVIGSDFERDEDAEFVANAPRDITNLLAEVERLKARQVELCEWIGIDNPVLCVTCESPTEESDEVCHNCWHKRDGSETVEMRKMWTEHTRFYPAPGDCERKRLDYMKARSNKQPNPEEVRHGG